MLFDTMGEFSSPPKRQKAEEQAEEPVEEVTNADVKAYLDQMRYENRLMWRHQTAILERIHTGIKAYLNEKVPGFFLALAFFLMLP